MISARRIVELISRNRVLKRRIEVRGRKVPILVSPDAQLKYLKPGSSSFDSDLIRIAECVASEDSVIWDVGANVGVFSIAALASSSSSRVLAIEADPWLANILVRTSEFDAYVNREFLVLPAAASNVNGIAEFLIATRGRASNALAEFGGRSQMGGTRRRQLVPTLTIDRIAEKLGPPEFIKIDVEGAEFAVLKGGRNTLKQNHPAIYIETSKETFKQCTELLGSLGYRCFDAKGNHTDTYHPNCFFVNSTDEKHLDKLHSLNG